ncbi:MAG TPA: hypothetical protein VF011_09330 [Terriglobales bacterium]
MAVRTWGIGNLLVQMPKVTHWGTYEELTVAATGEYDSDICKYLTARIGSR